MNGIMLASQILILHNRYLSFHDVLRPNVFLHLPWRRFLLTSSIYIPVNTYFLPKRPYHLCIFFSFFTSFFLPHILQSRRVTVWPFGSTHLISLYWPLMFDDIASTFPFLFLNLIDIHSYLGKQNGCFVFVFPHSTASWHIWERCIYIIKSPLCTFSPFILFSVLFTFDADVGWDPVSIRLLIHSTLYVLLILNE